MNLFHFKHKARKHHSFPAVTKCSSTSSSCIFFSRSGTENVGSSWSWIGNMRAAQPERTACRKPNAAACPPPSTVTPTSTAASTWPKTAPSSARDAPSTPRVPRTRTPARTTTSNSPPPCSAPGWPSTLKNWTKWLPRWRKGSL